MINRIVLPLLLLLSFSAAGQDAPLRLITVNGHGEVLAQPDRADVSMTIESRQLQLAAAREDVTERVNAFLREVDGLDIDRKRISNSGLIVRPEYRWNKADQQQELIAYYVARQIRVDLRDLSRLGPLLERAVSAGVNQVSPPVMGSSREDKLRREALRRASADAKLNAAAIAESLGVSVGPAHSVSAQQGRHAPPMPMRMHSEMAMMADASPQAEQSYEAGQISFTADISASFDLLTQ